VSYGWQANAKVVRRKGSPGRCARRRGPERAPAPPTTSDEEVQRIESTPRYEASGNQCAYTQRDRDVFVPELPTHLGDRRTVLQQQRCT